MRMIAGRKRWGWRSPVVAAALAVLWAGQVGAEPSPLPNAITVPPKALAILRHLAVQHLGRVKPFESFARETLETLTGSARVGGADPVATLLSIMAEPERWQAALLIAVPFRPLQEQLGLAHGQAAVSYDGLIATRTLMRLLPPIIEKQRRDEKLSVLENETMDAYNRFVTFNSLLEHEVRFVPPSARGDVVWTSIREMDGASLAQRETLQSAWAQLIASLRGADDAAIDASAHALSTALRAAAPAAYPAAWRLEWEVRYHRVAPFHVARWLYLVALVALVIGGVVPRSPASGVGFAALWAAFALHAAGIFLRVLLGGRPPVANFYETMLWLPFAGVVVALVFERVYRARYFAIAASALAAITLALADRLPLDPSITPIVAVLRSNLWLTIHVLTIVASYGAIALAAVLAHVHGGLYLARGARAAILPTLELCLSRTLQVGAAPRAAGIMLGAVWANASWGRYWGWDPKETWALITLLWYIALLHGRFAGWLRGVGLSLATIGGFFLLLMTYYGVSFYLVGLHSYAGGNAKPLPPLLIGYVLAELAFLGFTGLTALRRRAA